MIVRRFNQQGLERFSAFLDSLSSDEPQTWVPDLLIDEAASDRVEAEVEIDRRGFGNRLELARYLNERLGDAGIVGLDRDIGLWSWLSYFDFDHLCPQQAGQRRKPGERARWIPATGDFRRYYRHLLAGPYRIFRAHRDSPERAMALLCTPADKPGDIVEQLASRQDLVTSKAAVAAATRLYISPKTQKPKRGAAGRGPGSARRLADIFNQFDVTWNLFALDLDSVLRLLPREFDKFQK